MLRPHHTHRQRHTSTALIRAPATLGYSPISLPSPVLPKCIRGSRDILKHTGQGPGVPWPPRGGIPPLQGTFFFGLWKPPGHSVHRARQTGTHRCSFKVDLAKPRPSQPQFPPRKHRREEHPPHYHTRGHTAPSPWTPALRQSLRIPTLR